MATRKEIEANVKEIREASYGKDNRKPIADAIEMVKEYNGDRGLTIVQPVSVSAEATSDSESFALAFAIAQ